MKKTSEIPTNAHQRYENKRVSKPVSFNKEKHADLITLVEKIDFGVWVKHVLSSYTKIESELLKNDINLLPAILIEHALEAGNFDLDEYLLAKGKKIVDVKESAQPFVNYGDIDFVDIPFSDCDIQLNESDIYNQELEYQ